METQDLIKKVRKIEIKTRGLSSHIFSGEYHRLPLVAGDDFSDAPFIGFQADDFASGQKDGSVVFLRGLQADFSGIVFTIFVAKKTLAKMAFGKPVERQRRHVWVQAFRF